MHCYVSRVLTYSPNIKSGSPGSGCNDRIAVQLFLILMGFEPTNLLVPAKQVAEALQKPQLSLRSSSYSQLNDG